VSGEPAVEISIEDNGPGFVPAATERAFEPFFTTKSSGTGLGLAIVRRIVEAHGGQAFAERSARGSARIRLTIPIRGGGQCDRPPMVSGETHPWPTK
jgi:signal transduction histidine kinase